MHVRRNVPNVEVLTPAKLNLFLEVLSRRPDGFHQIETVMTSVTVGDTLTFAPQERPSVELETRWACGLAAKQAARRLRPPLHATEDLGELPAEPDNLAWKAATLIRQRAGEQRGARMSLVKRIPAAAGLGGASSDAAAALVAANLGWNLGWTRERLQELAAELGSDVPFFLAEGGVAVCRGRGEQIAPLRAARLHVVVVRPPVGLSTPEVYRRCRPAHAPASVQNLRQALECGSAAGVARHLANRLRAPAAELTSWIGQLEEEFSRQDCLGHQMSGSGSSYFGICRSARHAQRVASRLRARQAGTVYAVATAGA